MKHAYQEKRLTKRTRVFLGGEILVDRELPPIECQVKNISRSGAKITLSTQYLIPDRFELLIKKTNERHPAKVIWNNGHQLGVAYLTAPHQCS